MMAVTMTAKHDAWETTMSKPKEAGSPAVDRRSFFKALGAGATLAATPAMVTPAAAVDPGKEETKARYRESEHVKDFYRVNRY
ncbi:formate dehydrogenase [Bosea sp. (in: a-proteobacteria)]|jgi:hypothetical protein|uniref:formate dehydrogenase n=1 Tax=Bosea sp. (in: a-proteobacteria) TaxID=1871050 RepID=UPI0035235172